MLKTENMRKTCKNKIAIALILGVISCVTASFTSIAVRGFRMVAANMEGTSATLVQSACACKVKCLQTNCTTYSVTRSGDGPVECRVSGPPVRRCDWEQHGDSYIVHKSDYISRGQHFYQTKGNSTFSSTNKTCFSEGGQVPVLLNQDAENEFRGMMSYFGVQKAWVGAYRQAIRDSNGTAVGNEPTVWRLANGTVIKATNITEHRTNQCFIFDAKSSETFHNEFACTQKFNVICQRDY